MSQSSRWKSQGGMNRRPVNNIVRSSQTFGDTINTKQLGQVYTTIPSVSDVRSVDDAAIYNFNENETNFNNVISYYPFNLPDTTGEYVVIYNQSLAYNLPTPKPFDLYSKIPPSLSSLQPLEVVYNDLVNQNVAQLNPSSKVLTTDLSFNTYNAFGDSGSIISTALTISCFIYIKDSDISSVDGQSNQFCLFAMDDLNQSTLQSFSNSGSGVNGSNNLLYLWYPNKNGKAQLLYGYKSSNLAQAWSYINTESPNQIPTNKWVQVILVLAGLSVYVMIDGEVVIASSNSQIQGASYVPNQPFNINLGPYYYDPVGESSVSNTTTNNATPLLSDCKVSNWAVNQQMATAIANPGQYGHQYSVNNTPNKTGQLSYLISKDFVGFSTPTLFRDELTIGGNLQSYRTNNFYGTNTFYTKVYFADGFVSDASSSIVYQGETGNLYIDSSTPITTQKNASLLINNSSEVNGNDFMASMLVYNYVTDINNVPKSTLPTYNSNLQFSISGENVSVGNGFGDSSFNVFGDTTLNGKVVSQEFVGNGVTPIGGIIMWSGAIDLTNNSPQDTNGVVHSNWKICDGTNTTPDLRGRFIVGQNSGTFNNIGDVGGDEEVTLTSNQMPLHTHIIDGRDGMHTHKVYNMGNGSNQDAIPLFFTANTGVLNADIGGHDGGNEQFDIGASTWSAHDTPSGPHSHNISDAGASEPHNNLPPYFTLAYIMRIA